MQVVGCLTLYLIVIYVPFRHCVSLFCSVYCLCVNVYCATVTGCQTNCSYELYHIIYHIVSYIISYHISYHTIPYRITSYHMLSVLALTWSYRHFLNCFLTKSDFSLLSRLDENCTLQGYYAESSGNSLPTFADNLVPSWRMYWSLPYLHNNMNNSYKLLQLFN